MMQMNGSGCMSHLVGGADTVFSEVLQGLLDEHPPLRKQMEQLVEKSNQVTDLPAEIWQTEIQAILALEQSFADELEIHSKKEEDGLFLILGRHIGTNSGPIAIMNFEHEEARKGLASFEAEAAKATADLSPERVTLITTPLIMACMTLFDHFMKEENVLYPMAENALTVAEKEELAELIKA